MNVFTATARLGLDPISDETTGGTPVSKLRLAIPRRPRKDQPDPDPVWVDAVIYGARAAACNEHLRQGRLVGITGRLEHDVWQKDDQTHSRHYLVLDDVQFLGPKPETNGDGPAKR